MEQTCAPILGFVAYSSNTGKTTLLVKLITLLRRRGLRLGVIKHAHHRFEIDHEGKDSYVLRKAGAEQMLIASRHRWALMVETPDTGGEPRLSRLVARLDRDALDLILVEGFRHEAIPKIELHRAALGNPLLAQKDDSIIAVASDTPLELPAGVAQLGINDAEQIAGFVWERFLGD